MPDHRPLLILIDGHALAFRAFHALAESGLRTSHGQPTYAVYGFASIMLTTIEEHHPDFLAVSFDIGRTFRDDLYAEYKAGRAETPAEFEPQLVQIKRLVESFNIPIYTAEGFEADDVIGTLARQATEQHTFTLILTGDTDTLQLVDPYVQVLLANPYGRKTTTTVYGEAEVRERYKGLAPNQLADLRGLKGDTSDNIPGVRGIGEAGAIALLNQFGTIEAMYEREAEIPKRYQKPLTGQRETALFSKRLATIVRNAPVQLDLRAARLHDYDRTAVIALFQDLEFGASLIKRLPTPGGGVETSVLPPMSVVPQQADLFAAPPPTPAAHNAPQQIDMFGVPTAPMVPPALPVGYRAARSLDDVQTLVDELRAAPAFAFDTETLGTRPFQDDIVGLSVSTAPGSAWYVPLAHREGPQPPRDAALALLRPFFVDPHKPKYAHNAKFDLEVLLHAGIEVQGLAFDTMIAAGLLDKKKGLKDLAFYELRLSEPMQPIETLLGKGKSQITFDQVPIEQATPYACADADMTMRLVAPLSAQLRDLPAVQSLFEHLEMPLVSILTRMEQAGIGVNEAFLRDLGSRMATRIGELELQIYAIAEAPFNINSGDQLSDVLFVKLNMPTAGLERTKTGRYSLTAEVLEKLRADGQDTSGMIELILQHRQLSKLKSTYLDALPALVNPHTGRIHTTYSQLGAATGRLSSNDPNLQNIPTRSEEGREIRHGFVAAPGHVFLAADYSQIELRVLAYITQDPNLLDTFEQGYDIHAATAARLFGVPMTAVDKNQRRVSKTVTFGIIYGISAFGLAQRLGMPRSEAQLLINGLFEKFPAIREYIDRTLEDGRRDGFVATLFGRRRPVPDLRGGMVQRRQAAEREAINHPIQGTAADLMKIAMIRTDEALRAAGGQARMLLQVHDELIFEVPHGQTSSIIALVREAMEGVSMKTLQLRAQAAHTDEKQDVALRVEVEQGRTWGDLTPVG